MSDELIVIHVPSIAANQLHEKVGLVLTVRALPPRVSSALTGRISHVIFGVNRR